MDRKNKIIVRLQRKLMQKESDKYSKILNKDIITIITNYVCRKFFMNKIKSCCLGMSMFCKLLLEKYAKIDVKLNKGYVVYDNMFWGHFWLTYNGVVIDPGTYLFNLFNNFPLEQKRELLIKKPHDKECIDACNFESIQQRSYVNCNNGKFWEDLQYVCGLDGKKYFENIYDELDLEIHNLLMN